MTMSRRTQVFIVVATCLVAAFYFTLMLAAPRERPFGGSYRVRVLVPSAAALGARANVMIAGITVGRVDAVKRAGGRALLELRLDEDHAPLPVDSRYGVRLRTVVGENYVELVPGRSRRMVPDRGLLPASQAEEYVDVNEILDTLRGSARTHARQTLRAFGEGVRGHGTELNRVVDDGIGTIEDSAPVTTVLAHEKAQIARLTDELGNVMREVGDRGDAVHSLAEDLRATFAGVARQDANLRETLAVMPGALSQVRSTTGLLRAITRTSTPVLSNTAQAVRDLGSAIRLLRPVAQDGDALVRELGRSAPRLSATLARLPVVSEPATESLPRLRSVLCQVEPMAVYLKPYFREVTSVLQNMGYATNWYDANGHAARLFASVGEQTPKVLDAKTGRLVDTLLEAGLLGQLGAMGYNPFPKPGNAAETATTDSPATMDDVKQTYPRIKAQC